MDSKVAKTGSGASASSKSEKGKRARSKTGRQGRGPVKSRPRDADELAATEDREDVSAAAASDRDTEQKCDSGSVGETERTVAAAASEKDCCGDDEVTGCSAVAHGPAVQPTEDAMKHTSISACSADTRECTESSTSKSLPPTSSTTTPAAPVSKLKIFKCSESKKLCVRSADVPEPRPVEQRVAPAAAVRRSGSPVKVRKRGDDKHERRLHRRRRRGDPAKSVSDRQTIVDRTTTVSDVDTALSPVPSLPDATEDAAVDPPIDAVGKQQIISVAGSPLSGSDNVVSSSTSSRLLPDDEEDDDEVDATRRAALKSRPRRIPDDDGDAGDDGKSGDQAAAGGVVDGTAGDAATTLRVPIRLGGQSGQTGELLLRLPQNVSVQCSFRADQILIASSPATTSTEQSTVSTDACVTGTASSDVELTASQQDVSDTLITQ